MTYENDSTSAPPPSLSAADAADQAEFRVRALEDELADTKTLAELRAQQLRVEARAYELLSARLREVEAENETLRERLRRLS